MAILLTKPVDPTSEIDLSALLAGDRPAWHAFVEIYAPVIHATARRSLMRYGFGDDEVAEVVQNVFLRLCDKNFRLLRTYDPARAGLGTWIRVVSSSATIDHMRRQKRTLPIDELSEALVAVPADEPVPLNIPNDLLTPRQRLVLTLIYEHDLDVADVAQMLGVTAQTVRSTRHKAIERLRTWVRKDQDIR